MSLLRAEHLTVQFGGLVAVKDVSFSVEPGQIFCIIGPNGAGKTTLFNVLTGFERADHGSWAFDGDPLAGRRAHQIARAGMVRTFQLTKALARLTVLDNMLLASPAQRGERFTGALAQPRASNVVVSAKVPTKFIRFINTTSMSVSVL